MADIAQYGSHIPLTQEEYRYDYDYSYMYDENGTYVYDMEESMDHLPLKEFVPLVTIYSIIGLLGLVGNLLVICAIARVQRMQSITNLFLVSLASADLLLVVVCVPVKGISFFSYTWRLGEFVCKGVHYIQTVSMVCSALTLTVMSIERFVAIRYPLKARSFCTIRHARVVIVSVWVASFIAAIPIIFGIEYRTVGLHVEANYCHKYWLEKPTFGKVFELYMLLIILVIPVSVMVVTYTWIANIIWHVATRRADMRSGSCVSTNSVSPIPDVQPRSQVSMITAPMPSNAKSKAYMDDDRTRKQVVMMLMVVVVLFATCWTPILVNNVLVAFEHLNYLNMGYLKPMRMAFHILSFANSCINPFVYAFMSKNFRDGFKKFFWVCVRGKAYNRQKQMSARSVTSTTRASSSQSGERFNGQRSDSIAMRRPSDMDDMDFRKL